MRFFGTDERSVDDKGRVSLPAKMRKALPDEVVIVPGFDDALYVFSEEAFLDWVDSFFPEEEGGYDPRKRAHIELRSALTRSAESVNIDAAGRVKIPAKQRVRASIEKDVTVTGNDDHIELWDSRKFARHDDSFSIDDLLED
jgi:MraZ protein